MDSGAIHIAGGMGDAGLTSISTRRASGPGQDPVPPARYQLEEMEDGELVLHAALALGASPVGVASPTVSDG